MSDLFLGIDTSNYKTSVAVTDNKSNIIADCRKFLCVKNGEKGLRQSQAFFQHIQNLPQLIEEALNFCDVKNIRAVAVSSKPRPVEGSYMPVFTAGLSLGKAFAMGRDIPIYTFSHQEGHIEAVKRYSCLRDSDSFICYHFSGGTTEAILMKDGVYEKIGGTYDLAIGQLIDRIGIHLDMRFPAGEEMDRIAESFSGREKNLLPKVKIKDGYFNLSGLENKAYSLLERGTEKEVLIWMLFERLAIIMEEETEYFRWKYGITDFIFAGGVSGSRFIRNYLEYNRDRDCIYVFGEGNLSSDNAVGTALLGGEMYGA